MPMAASLLLLESPFTLNQQPSSSFGLCRSWKPLPHRSPRSYHPSPFSLGHPFCRSAMHYYNEGTVDEATLSSAVRRRSLGSSSSPFFVIQSVEEELCETALLQEDPADRLYPGQAFLTNSTAKVVIELQKQLNKLWYSRSDSAVPSFTALTRHHTQICTAIRAPPALINQKEGNSLAAFKWLDTLSGVYGVPMIVLVGIGYWMQGFRCFPWLTVNFYFKDVLLVDPSTLQIVQNTVNLPMVAKPVYGIVSDSVYIRGAHRVPYLVIGGFLQAISWGIIVFLPVDGTPSVLTIATLLALSNLGASMVDVANDALVAECSKKKKSTGELQSFAWFSTAVGGVLGNMIAAFALSRMENKLMFGIFGLLLIVQSFKSLSTNEGSFGLSTPMRKRSSLVVDSAKLAKERPAEVLPCPKLAKERPAEVLPYPMSGSSNVLPYPTSGSPFPMTRPLDMVCTSISSRTASAKLLRRPYAGSTEATEEEGRPASMNVAMDESYLEEEHIKSPGIWQQFTGLVHLVRRPDILYPLTWFMASYAMVPTLAGTMFYFQTEHLKVDPSIVGLSKVMGQVGLMGGSAVYTQYLKAMPMRKLLVAVQVLLCFCTLFDMLLVKRVNVDLGIPDGVLVLGASAFVDALNQFKVLPFMVLLGQLCPAGREGSLLAAFMSGQCLATIVSGFMGVALASLLHISSEDFSELPTGILVQSMAALVPLFWISFLPEGPNEKNTR